MQNSKDAVLLFVASYLCVSYGAPLPGFPTIHSLATFDTTRSYLYTKHLGLNNRFLKPARSAQIIPSYTKYISNPYQSQVFVLPQLAVSSQVTPEDPQNFAAAPAVRATSDLSELTNQIQLNPDKEATISLFLTPPKQGAFVSTSFDTLDEVHKASQVNEVSESGVLPPAQDTVQEPLTNEPNPNGNSINHHQSELDFSGFVPANPIRTGQNDKARNEILPKDNDKSAISTNDFNNLDDADLLKLIMKISNHGKSTKSSDESLESNTALENDQVESKPEMESRQDSSIEQPTPFLSTVPKLEPLFNQQQQQPQPQLNFPQVTNGRFTLPSQQPSSQFPTTPQQQPQNTNNFAEQNPSSHNAPNQVSPERPFTNGNSNGFALPPNFPQNRPQQFLPPALQFPGANFLNSPQQRQLGGPSPPEPENGYNPFHLHDNFPEPPYESEFANEPPLEDEPSARSHLDQSGHPPVLDFAQSTLRNVRTEELLEVTQRKPVPPGCAYNTISYGLNGEDCVERRKRHARES